MAVSPGPAHPLSTRVFQQGLLGDGHFEKSEIVKTITEFVLWHQW